MRIVMPYDKKNGKISMHLGEATFFKFYNVEGNVLISSFTMASGVTGHEATAAFFKQAGAQLVICGGLGGPMIKALNANGIMVMGGILGDADTRMQEFLDGTIQYQPIDPKRASGGCHHHEDGSHHGCSHHGEEGCNHPNGACDHMDGECNHNDSGHCH